MSQTPSLSQRGGIATANVYVEKQVAQLWQRDRAMHALLRFTKLRSGVFEPLFGGLRSNVHTSSIARWKANV